MIVSRCGKFNEQRILRINFDSQPPEYEIDTEVQIVLRLSESRYQVLLWKEVLLEDLSELSGLRRDINNNIIVVL